MSTQEETLRLKPWPGTIAWRIRGRESNAEVPGNIERGKIVITRSVEKTDAANTVSVEVRGYQSIVPLAGKYAEASFMKTLPEFLERYDEEINKLYNE